MSVDTLDIASITSKFINFADLGQTIMDSLTPPVDINVLQGDYCNTNSVLIDTIDSSQLSSSENEASLFDERLNHWLSKNRMSKNRCLTLLESSDIEKDLTSTGQGDDSSCCFSEESGHSELNNNICTNILKRSNSAASANFGICVNKINDPISRLNSRESRSSSVVDVSSLISVPSFHASNAAAPAIDCELDYINQDGNYVYKSSKIPDELDPNALNPLSVPRSPPLSPPKSPFKSSSKKTLQKVASPKGKLNQKSFKSEEASNIKASSQSPSSRLQRKSSRLFLDSPSRPSTPHAKTITSLSGSFLSQHSNSELPYFADVLLPLNMAASSSLNVDVAGAYTLDHGNVFVSVAAPMPITDSELLEDGIRQAEIRLLREFDVRRRTGMVSSIRRRLFGEVKSLNIAGTDESNTTTQGVFHKRSCHQYFIESETSDCQSDTDVDLREHGPHKVLISIRKVDLSKSSKSQQDSKTERVEFGGFPSRGHAQRFAEAMAPPLWVDNSEVCYMCRHTFAVFRKARHCRNCGQMVCADCSTKDFPGFLLPSTFHSNEKCVRVCGCCNYLSDLFSDALLSKDLERVKLLMETGNVNIRSPLRVGVVGYAYPIHLVAQGGNISMMKWILEEMKCPILENGTSLKTSEGMTCFSIASKYEHREIMEYLVSRNENISLEGAEGSQLREPLVAKLHRWLPKASWRSSSSIPEASAVASLITGNPSAGFLIEANVTCVMAQSALTSRSPSVVSASPDQNRSSGVSNLTPTSNVSAKNYNSIAKTIVENEILRLEEAFRPSYVNANAGRDRQSITIPYDEEDVMDFQDYALRNVMNQRNPHRRSSSRASSTSESSVSNSQPSRSRSSSSSGDVAVGHSRRGHHNRRTISTPSQFYHSRVLHGNQPQGSSASYGRSATRSDRSATRNYVTRPSAPSAPPGALHVIPRHRSQRAPERSVQDRIPGGSYTPEQERRIAAARARLLRARAELDARQRRSRTSSRA